MRPAPESSSLATSVFPYRRLLLAGVVAVAGCEQAPAPVPPQTEAPVQTAPGISAASPQWATYRLAGRVVPLTDGRHDEAAAPGSAARNTTVVWGAPATGDLDQDGDDDAVVILVNEPGGSGTFYYLAAAELERNGFNGSAAVLLGDRIALQSVTVANGIITVNLVDRRAGESLASEPSVATSRRYVYAEDELRELEAPAARDGRESPPVPVLHLAAIMPAQTRGEEHAQSDSAVASSRDGGAHRLYRNVRATQRGGG